MSVQGSHDVKITDVALRDGLQNEDKVLSTEQKVEIARAIVGAGITSMEVGSFVRADLVPQMADSGEVVAQVKDWHGLEAIGLVPNLHGVRAAIAAGAGHIRTVISASEGHSQSNSRRSVDQGLAEAERIFQWVAEQDRDIGIGISIATAFVCPFDGVTSAEQLSRVVAHVYGSGYRKVILADTIGQATPMQVEQAMGRLSDQFSDVEWGLHTHNTYDFALANIWSAWRQGVRWFDGAVGGIGGCPFAPGATGNSATEDIVCLFENAGIDTGIDLEGLGSVATRLSRALGHRLDSAMSRVRGWNAAGA
jgi:hydroxymethylglutaryl-CoA lyase